MAASVSFDPVSDSLPPVAIRVARPYATEDELLENELETFTRTSITLLGAQPRPQGLVLRFELVLASGNAVVRGEGRVVGYKSNVYYGLGGLTLRFTRLDSRSKGLVDKAAALRERRRPSAVPSIAPELSSSDLLAPDVTDVESGPLPAEERPHDPARVSGATERSRTTSAPPLAPLPQPEPVRATGDTAGGRSPNDTPSGRSPNDRDALLERLRARSRSLGEDAMQRLLEKHK